jgi:hypothetical protein
MLRGIRAWAIPGCPDAWPFDPGRAPVATWLDVRQRTDKRSQAGHPAVWITDR